MAVGEKVYRTIEVKADVSSSFSSSEVTGHNNLMRLLKMHATYHQAECLGPHTVITAPWKQLYRLVHRASF